MTTDRLWATRGLYRRSLGRKIRDLFDPSYTSGTRKSNVTGGWRPARLTSKTPELGIRKKEIIFTIPEIKFEGISIKRLAYIFTIVVMAILLTFGIFVTMRVIALTDGDFLGETFLERVNSFMHSRVTPIENKVDLLNERMNALEEYDDTRRFRDAIRYKPTVKVYNIYNKNGLLIRREIKGDIN